MYFSGIIIHCALALTIGLVLCPIIIKFAHKHSWYDQISPRKLHTNPIPRIGGVAIFWSGALAYFFATTLFSKYVQPTNNTPQVWPILLGIACIHALGILDDFINIRARYKLIAQLCIATIPIAAGHQFRGCDIPIFNVYLNFGILSHPITLIWIVGITNAINLLDGMDGLASTTGIIISTTFAAIFISKGLEQGAILAITLTGSLIAFLVFNWNPARIFMGDGGSLVVGYTLACLPLIQSPTNHSIISLPLATLALAVPIIDTFNVMFERSRSGRPLMSPDKEHIHHQLLRLGLNQIESLAIISGSTLALCILSFISTTINTWAQVASNFIFIILFACFLRTLVEANRQVTNQTTDL